MTKDEINRFLAEKVMGYKELAFTSYMGGNYVYVEPNRRIYSPVNINVSDWNPMENIAQAMEIVDKIVCETVPFALEFDGEEWTADFIVFREGFNDVSLQDSFNFMTTYRAIKEKKESAICHAAIEAAKEA